MMMLNWVGLYIYIHTYIQEQDLAKFCMPKFSKQLWQKLNPANKIKPKICHQRMGRICLVNNEPKVTKNYILDDNKYCIEISNNFLFRLLVIQIENMKEFLWNLLAWASKLYKESFTFCSEITGNRNP
jgi:hypothetical protein